LFFNFGDSIKYHKVKKKTSKNNITVKANQNKCLLKKVMKLCLSKKRSLYDKFTLFITVNIWFVSHKIIKGAKNHFTIQAKIETFSLSFIFKLGFLIFFIK